MEHGFTASITREGDWYIAQCLEVDVASQGESEGEALVNLHEALELYFAPPVAALFRGAPVAPSTIDVMAVRFVDHLPRPEGRETAGH